MRKIATPNDDSRGAHVSLRPAAVARDRAEEGHDNQGGAPKCDACCCQGREGAERSRVNKWLISEITFIRLCLVSWSLCDMMPACV